MSDVCLLLTPACGGGSARYVGVGPMEAFRPLSMCDMVQQRGMVFVSLLFILFGGDRRGVHQNGL